MLWRTGADSMIVKHGSASVSTWLGAGVWDAPTQSSANDALVRTAQQAACGQKVERRGERGLRRLRKYQSRLGTTYWTATAGSGLGFVPRRHLRPRCLWFSLAARASSRAPVVAPTVAEPLAHCHEEQPRSSSAWPAQGRADD